MRLAKSFAKPPSVGGGATYRYLRFMFPSPASADYPTVSELYWIASGTDYPTVAMTSATSPAPLAVTQLGGTGGGAAVWRAFDKATGTGNVEWHPFDFGDGSLTLDLGAGNEIAPTGIGIVTASVASKNFRCYGSNNATFTTGQVLLYTSGTVSTGWTANVRRNFTF
jgi:hypothetical protein